MAVTTPGLQDRSRVHRDWGNYSGVGDLPNAAANALPAPEFQKLEPGDRAYVEQLGEVYVCLSIGTVGGADAVWRSVARSVLTWGDDSVAASTATRYLAPGWDDGVAATAPRQILSPRSGIARSLQIIHQLPRGNGNLIVYTLRVNNVVTALSVSLASTAAIGGNVIANVPIAVGDILDIEVTKAINIGLTPLRIGASLEIA